MLSENLKHFGDTFSYFVESSVNVTFTMSQLTDIVREIRSMEAQAVALEKSTIPESLRQPEIAPANGSNVIQLNAYKPKSKRRVK